MNWRLCMGPSPLKDPFRRQMEMGLRRVRAFQTEPVRHEQAVPGLRPFYVVLMAAASWGNLEVI
jgi:hypothetical protein